MRRRFQNLVKRVPLRIHLGLLYMLTFGIISFVFLTRFYVRFHTDISPALDTGLELAYRAIEDQVAVDADGRLQWQAREDMEWMSKGFTFYLLAPDGTKWDSLGDDKVPVVHQDGIVSLESGKRNEEREWRSLTRPVLSADGEMLGWLQIAQPQSQTEDIVSNIAGHLPLILLLAGLAGFFLVSYALRPIRHITSTAESITTHDLTQRINYDGADDEVGQLAQTFDNMLDRLEAGFERERRFASDAAHELRTPLTALKGRIGVTLSQPRQPEVYVETLHDMEEQVDRLIRLSNDLLFMTRFESRREQIALEPIELTDFLSVVIDQVRHLANDKAITLVEQVPSQLVVRGNMDLLIRLFLNLLDNAIKYTPAGGQVTVTAENSAAQVRITVQDTGPGIAPEHLPHLFERFYRVEGDRTRLDGGGAGLGLAIAREVARAHGGDLTVQSEVGDGTTFVFTIPIGDK